MLLHPSLPCSHRHPVVAASLHPCMLPASAESHSQQAALCYPRLHVRYSRNSDYILLGSVMFDLFCLGLKTIDYAASSDL